jgi:ABC-type phosphonate transport system ATPase subunit
MSIEHTATNERAAFSIDEFCEAHRISRNTLYRQLAAGTGPRLMCVGARKLISVEAAADWRAAQEVPKRIDAEREEAA